jgi:hypothetical protein
MAESHGYYGVAKVGRFLNSNTAPCTPVGAVERSEAAIFPSDAAEQKQDQDQKIAACGSSYGDVCA